MAITEGWLPPYEGLLPKWMLFLSIVSIFNSVQCYRSIKLSQIIYNADPENPSRRPIPKGDVSQSTVTGLSTRTFGTWTIITAIVRFYAAYNIDNPVMYKVALATYLTAFGHFTSEWLVFGTARFNSSLASPLCISTGTMVWMLCQWGWYVQ